MMMVGPIVCEPPAVSRRGYTRWTEERDAELRHRYEVQCERRRDIAVAMGLSVEAVRSRLHQIGARRPVSYLETLPSSQRPGPGSPVCGRPRGAVRVVKHRLRCLGSSDEGEHYFWSRDRRTHRMCDRCRAKIGGMG